MKKLLLKELRLAIHPINVIFLLLSAMLLIPSYPYYVTFFYTSLGLFFLSQSGRENHDIEFTMMLPVSRRDLVRARVLFAVLIELTQMLVAVPFAIISQHINPFGNMAGMDANVAFFGLSLLMLGLFNAVFFPLYYAHPWKVGRAFIFGSIAEALYVLVVEIAAHKVTFVRRYLDTPDPAYLGEKLVVLAVGMVLFIALTALGCRQAEKKFEIVDL